jgi:hypothetical protein
MGKYREFIACKRTKKSSWQYSEYSAEDDLAFDAIAPDCGNYEKLRLIEIAALAKANAEVERLRESLKALEETQEQDFEHDLKPIINARNKSESLAKDWYDKFFTQREHNGKLKDLLRDCLPIVEAAYWDNHTAGIMPGSGYNNKAQHLSGVKWDWRNSKKFKDWLKSANEALSEVRK